MIRIRLTCPHCRDTGFIAVRRGRLWIDRRKRAQDLRPFIIYLPCNQCEALHAQIRVTNPDLAA